jgi:hypothetical protein
MGPAKALRSNLMLHVLRAGSQIYQRLNVVSLAVANFDPVSVYRLTLGAGKSFQLLLLQEFCGDIQTCCHINVVTVTFSSQSFYKIMPAFQM